MTITVKTLSESIDIGQVEADARRTWERDQRRRRRIENTIIKLLPFGLVIMSVSFYLLSAPHTAYLINLITPGWGFVAPIAFELGVLIISAGREAGWRNALTLTIELALILMSMVINVIGGFIAVVAFGTNSVRAGVDIQALTLNQLFAEFGSIPAVYQAALSLVVPVGMVIPFMAALVGEILVKLSLGRIRLEQETDEQRWQKDAARVMFNALLQAALKAGAGAKTAGHFAQAVIDQMYSFRPVELIEPPSVRPLSASVRSSASGQVYASVESQRQPMGFVRPSSVSGQADSGRTADNSGQTHGHGEGYTRRRNAKEIVRAHLREHPEDIKADCRELGERIGVGKTVVNEVQREFRS